MAKFLVRNGLNYPSGKRVEPGEVVDDIPSADIKWLRDQGHIEDFDSKTMIDVASVSVDDIVKWAGDDADKKAWVVGIEALRGSEARVTVLALDEAVAEQKAEELKPDAVTIGGGSK